MPNLTAQLAGGATSSLSFLALTQVVMNAPAQGSQPSGDDEEFTVLGEGDPSAA